MTQRALYSIQHVTHTHYSIHVNQHKTHLISHGQTHTHRHRQTGWDNAALRAVNGHSETSMSASPWYSLTLVQQYTRWAIKLAVYIWQKLQLISTDFLVFIS